MLGGSWLAYGGCFGSPRIMFHFTFLTRYDAHKYILWNHTRSIRFLNTLLSNTLLSIAFLSTFLAVGCLSSFSVLVIVMRIVFLRQVPLSGRLELFSDTSLAS